MNSLNKALLALSAFAPICGWNGGASASILGDTLTLSYDYPARTTSASGVLVLPSTFKLTNLGSQSALDIGEHLISFAYGSDTPFDSISFDLGSNVTFNGAAFNGPVLTVDSGNPFGPVSSVKGLPAGDVTDTGSTLSINWQGVSFKAGNAVIITFGNAVSVSAVPLPASLPMFGAALFGLGALGYGMTRNRKTGLPA